MEKLVTTGNGLASAREEVRRENPKKVRVRKRLIKTPKTVNA
jgi:hypothetical protein